MESYGVCYRRSVTRNLLDRTKKPNFIVKNARSIPPSRIRCAKQLLYTTPFLTYI